MKKNRIFIKYYTYHIRLLRQGKKKRAFFKIIVFSPENRIIANLGYIMPSAYKNKIKPIGINRNRSIFWLLKYATPSYFVFFIFENVGLIKYNKLEMEWLNKIY